MAITDLISGLQKAQLEGTIPLLADADVIDKLNYCLAHSDAANAADIDTLQTDLNTAEAAIDVLEALFTALGLTGKVAKFGAAAFTTTGTTKAVSAGDVATIDFAVAFYKDTPAVASTDGPLSITATVGGGNVTVTRPAGTTSGAAFFYLLIGDPA